MKKKILAFIFATIFVSVCFTGCKDIKDADDNTLDIVCTSFPEYDWVKNITKDAENIKVTLLNDTGTDMHSFAPSTKNILEIKSCDVLVYIGGESDNWINDAISNEKASPVTVSLIALAQKENQELVFTNHHSDAESQTHTHSTSEIDEHIWLSVKKAIFFTQSLTDILCLEDPSNTEIFRKNAQEYTQKLMLLDKDYENLCNSAKNRVIVVADRFPFSYLAQDYNLECYSAFPGCSSDTDASFDTIIRLASLADQYELSDIAVTETASGKTADAVISATAQKNMEIVRLDSLQSVSKKDIENGTTYISVMEKNLSALGNLLSVE